MGKARRIRDEGGPPTTTCPAVQPTLNSLCSQLCMLHRGCTRAPPKNSRTALSGQRWSISAQCRIPALYRRTRFAAIIQFIRARTSNLSQRGWCARARAHPCTAVSRYTRHARYKTIISLRWARWNTQTDTVAARQRQTKESACKHRQKSHRGKRTEDCGLET